MPKSVYAVESDEKQQKRRISQSCVTRMCGGDLCYIGMKW